MDARIPGLALLPSETGGTGRELGSFYIPHKDLHGRCRSIQHFDDFTEFVEGGFGTFFRARDLDVKKSLILKAYDLDTDLSDESFTLVMTEINTLQRMEHKNLVPLLEVVSGEILESLCVVFDHYQHSLKDLLMHPSFLVPHMVKKILQEILQGLRYLHSSNYCHGNLNPENILFDSAGVLKIGDYTNPNIYHKTTPDGREITDPVLNNMLRNCVLRYKPLEILMGCRKQHPAIDMWAVGCIFAELLLKKPLFSRASAAALCEDIINLLGFPGDARLPGFSILLRRNNIQVQDTHRSTRLRKKFIGQETTCTHLLAGLFVYNLRKRLTAEQCLMHQYFIEDPVAGTDENLAHLLRATLQPK